MSDFEYLGDRKILSWSSSVEYKQLHKVKYAIVMINDKSIRIMKLKD